MESILLQPTSLEDRPIFVEVTNISSTNWELKNKIGVINTGESIVCCYNYTTPITISIISLETLSASLHEAKILARNLDACRPLIVLPYGNFSFAFSTLDIKTSIVIYNSKICSSSEIPFEMIGCPIGFTVDDSKNFFYYLTKIDDKLLGYSIDINTRLRKLFQIEGEISNLKKIHNITCINNNLFLISSNKGLHLLDTTNKTFTDLSNQDFPSTTDSNYSIYFHKFEENPLHFIVLGKFDIKNDLIIKLTKPIKAHDLFYLTFCTISSVYNIRSFFSPSQNAIMALEYNTNNLITIGLREPLQPPRPKVSKSQEGIMVKFAEIEEPYLVEKIIIEIWSENDEKIIDRIECPRTAKFAVIKNQLSCNIRLCLSNSIGDAYSEKTKFILKSSLCNKFSIKKSLDLTYFTWDTDSSASGYLIKGLIDGVYQDLFQTDDNMVKSISIEGIQEISAFQLYYIYPNSEEHLISEVTNVIQCVAPKFYFTKLQREYLDNFFRINEYPSKDEVNSISQVLSVSEKRVSIWFCNKRNRKQQLSPIN